ncbi:MAG TPA: WYL domain-containing protein [Flavobacteriaceae bacterium]|nr:WYL domain-containing protein [Flavobacteriaceae bacterium]
MNYTMLRRLELLIDLLRYRPGLNKDEIIELFKQQERELTERTLERALSVLRGEFQIYVDYNRAKKGYFLSTENQERIQNLLKFFELIHLGELIKQGLEDFDTIRDKIELEDSSNLKGIGQLKDILLAIKKKKRIHFTHENYIEGTRREYTITPLLLKEHANRWYVVGVPQNGKIILTFGIDRMRELKVGKISKVKRKDFEAQLDQFINIIGLNYKEHDKVEKIVLKVTSKQIKYLDSLPLHHSQNIEIEEGAKYGLVTYYLIPNYEFEMEILKLKSKAEVLEPAWFRDKIKDIITDMLANYEVVNKN